MRFSIIIIIMILSLPVFGQQRYDVVIQEIMPDPSPVVGLPPVEWVEIRNRSGQGVSLQGWRIADAGGRSGPLPAIILKPDSVMLVCAASSVSSLSAYGLTASVTSFPALDNDGEWLALLDGKGSVMHSVDYRSSWHANTLKRGGGWTLEMINPDAPCAGADNWISATDETGGSPGRVNNAENRSASYGSPVLQRAYHLDSSAIVLLFDQAIDSVAASSIERYSSSAFPVIAAEAVAPLFTEVRLHLQGVMKKNEIYRIEVDGLTDCSGKPLDAASVRFALPDLPHPSAVVVNEIMFNPLPLQQDYVELYNNSNLVIDLSDVSVGNRSSTGMINDLTALSSSPFLFFPGDYFLATPDKDQLQTAFPQSNSANHHSIGLPSFPDDKGVVVITGQQGEIIDEVNYSEKWHFELISNREGVALEKIDPGLPSGLARSWHSASTASGYGTPGHRNSQLINSDTSQQELHISPDVFSPDNDGIEDQCLIRYRLPAAGYVANVWIYDLHGRMIRRLVRGDLLAASGYWTWDGLDENKQHLPVAPYIICTELFNLSGRTKRFRNVAVLARRIP